MRQADRITVDSGIEPAREQPESAPIQARVSKSDPGTRRPGTFLPGNKPPNPRKPGRVNVITRDIKRGIIDAAEKHGSDGRGKDGLTGYLFHLSRKHPKAFAGLLGKLLPLQVSGHIGHSVGAVNIIAVPADRYLTAEDMARLTAPAPELIEHESQPVPDEGDQEEK